MPLVRFQPPRPKNMKGYVVEAAANIRKLNIGDGKVTELMVSPYPVETIQTDNERVVYLSGPHGVGKSTLIESLKDDIKEIDIVEQIAHMESLDEMTNRQIWRVALHAIEHRQNMIAAQANPKAIILGDRCSFDDAAYMLAFKGLGWVTDKHYKAIAKLITNTYKLSGTPYPKKFIIVIPPVEWNIERLQERWKESKDPIKWRENDLGYLIKVREAFEYLAAPLVKKKQALVLRETDAKVRIEKIRAWLSNDARLLNMERGQTYTERQSEYRSNNNS